MIHVEMARLLTALLAAFVLAGCGGAPELDPAAARELRESVEAVRLAAGEGDREGALRALEDLSERVDAAAGDGALSEEDAAALRRGVRRTRGSVEREVVPAQPAQEPEGTPAPDETAEPEPEETPAPEEDNSGEGGGDEGGGDEEGDDD